MKLLYAWAESLLIFKPDNAKKFLYVTWRALRFSYPLYFLWLLIPGALWGFLYAVDRFVALPLTAYPLTIAFIILFSLFTILLSPLLFACLATRASTLRKNFAYFKSYFSYALYFSISFFLTFLLWIGAVIIMYLLSSFIVPQPIWEKFAEAHIIESYLTAITTQLYLLPFRGVVTPALIITWLNFYFDLSKFNFFKSLGKALKLVLFNAPVCMLFSACMWGFIYLIKLAMIWIGYYTETMFAITAYLLTPIPVCIFTNLYLMKLHQQPELYFEKPKKE